MIWFSAKGFAVCDIPTAKPLAFVVMYCYYTNLSYFSTSVSRDTFTNQRLLLEHAKCF